MPLICRRCLIEDMESERDLFALMGEWIDAIPDELRAPENAYAARLRACSDCDRLNSGTCQLCGCYVELRAAKLRMSCPDLPDRWSE